MIVIPKDVAIVALLKAEELEHTENQVRIDIVNGVHPVDAYKKYGWF